MALQGNMTPLEMLEAISDGAGKVPEPVAGNLVTMDAQGGLVNGGPLPIVLCNSVYDAAAKTHALTRQNPAQQTGRMFHAVFVPDQDFTVGDVLTLDGESFDIRYSDWNGAVINGAFLAGMPVTMTLEKDEV